MKDFMSKFSPMRTLRRLALWQAGELDRLRLLSEYQKSQFLNHSKLEAELSQRLKYQLLHAVDQCEYYASMGVERQMIQDDPFRALQEFPVLQRRTVQQGLSRLLAKGSNQANIFRNQTGGSTGEPVVFYVDKARQESRMAATLRHDEWAGLRLGDRRAVVWGAPQDMPPTKWRSRARQYLMGNQLWLDTSHITESKVVEFVRALKRFRPKVIIAYATSMAMVARVVREKGIQPYQPTSIITSAEVLSNENRRLISETFGCPIFNRYGCREFGVIASECGQHAGMHTMTEGLLVEVTRDGNPVKDGEQGMVLVTDLLNRAMPLIRYQIGDMARATREQCPCGRTLTRITEISGRVTDFLIASDGSLVSGVFLATYLIASRPSLGKVQLVQRELRRLTFKILKGENFSESTDIPYLTDCARKYLGSDIAIDFEFVDNIPPSASGKTQFSVCEVPHQLTDIAPVASVIKVAND
jgi:phenylacetate-CoA ligase